jgi:hypothetical protein
MFVVSNPSNMFMIQRSCCQLEYCRIKLLENDLLFKNITVNIKDISAAVIHCYMEVRLLAPLFILSVAVIPCYTEVYFLAPP